jgi:Ca-activated chloride channel family protein
MTLANGWILHFLWILPLTGFALIVKHRRRRQSMERFAEPALLTRLTVDDHKGRRFIKGILILCALGILLLALAGPRWGNHYQEVSRKGVDIMFLVDVSRSMMVEDVKPNRLERARREIVDFIKVVEGDRVGLTAFAGDAFVQCPLTLDYAALEIFLSALQPDIIPVSGTDIGAAIETGMSAFDFKIETDKVMLLITDGEDNEDRGLEAARDAARQGVKIFVFGIGEPSGGPVPAGSEQGGFAKDRDGKLVLSKLDERTLQDLAAVTGGGYVRSVAGDLDLDLLYFEGIKQKTEAQTLKSGKIKIYEERFNVFVLAALLLLLVEELLDDKRRPPSRKRFGIFIWLGVCSLLPSLLPNPSLAADPPDKLYRQGRYEEAEKAYAKADMDHPKDIRFRYNRGCAAFQNGQYQEADAAFSSVMRRAKDGNVRFRAAYNLGNTAYKQGDYATAATYYKEALTANPDSEDARYNFELALRAIEQGKQKQPDASNADPQMGDKKEEGKEEKNSEKFGQSQNQGSEKKDQNKEDTPKGDSEKRPDDSKTDDTTAHDGNQNPGSTRDEKPETEHNEDLSGKLGPRQALSEFKKKNGEPEADNATTDKKKAEALLDNVQENPAELLRLMFPEENRQRTASGRDW